MMGMHGGLVDDVDADYARLLDSLKTNSKFVGVNDFLFAYKPLIKRDHIDINDCLKEARDLGLATGKFELKLRPELFR